MTARPIFRRCRAHAKLSGTQEGDDGASRLFYCIRQWCERFPALWHEPCHRMFPFMSPGAAADESADVLPLDKHCSIFAALITLEHTVSLSPCFTHSWLCCLCTLLLFRVGSVFVYWTLNLRRPHIKDLKAFCKQKVGGCVLSSACMCTFVHSFWVCLLSAGHEGVCVSVQLCPLVLWSGSHELMRALLSQRLNSSIIYKSECQQPRLAHVCAHVWVCVCLRVFVRFGFHMCFKCITTAFGGSW